MSNDSSSPTKAVEPRTTRKTKRPKRFRVLLHNDNYTTMDFVVEVLQTVFRKTSQDAVQIMLNVHHSGVGMAGVYQKQVAETKIGTVHEKARDAGYPLKCSLEPE